MVLPISGFMPVPLAMMIPFMFMQSIMMGYGFGTGFQYSKRKISAMSNEEFNKTTMKDEANKMFAAYTKIIPDLETSIRESKDLQVTIVEEMVKIPAHLLNALLGTGTEGSATPESPAAVPVSPKSPNFPKTAADVFKTTPKKDPFDPVNALHDSNTGADPTIMSVWRKIWVKGVTFSNNLAKEKIEARRWFYKSFPDSRHLIVQKVHWVRTSKREGFSYNEWQIIYYID